MYLWLDLETTGLDADSGEIIEVGWMITDNWEILSPAQSRIVTPTRDTFDLMKQDLVVSTMHQDNGLVNALVMGETMLVEDIEHEILRDIAEQRVESDKWVILAGASVHFDRTFVQKYMWRLDRELSYRHFDVSTLKMFFDSVGFPHLGERDTPSTHRALNDVKDSYRLARKYVNLINLMVDEGDINAERKSL